jgi:hypothetical protein
MDRGYLARVDAELAGKAEFGSVASIGSERGLPPPPPGRRLTPQGPGDGLT